MQFTVQRRQTAGDARHARTLTCRRQQRAETRSPRIAVAPELELPDARSSRAGRVRGSGRRFSGYGERSRSGAAQGGGSFT